jgi:hypothetical protein
VPCVLISSFTSYATSWIQGLTIRRGPCGNIYAQQLAMAGRRQCPSSISKLTALAAFAEAFPCCTQARYMNNGPPLLFQAPPLNVTIPQPDAADVQAHAQAMAAAGMGANQMPNYSGMPPGMPGMSGLQNMAGMHSIPVSDGNGGWYYLQVMPQGAAGPGGQGAQGHPMLLGLPHEGEQPGMGPGAMGMDQAAAAAAVAVAAGEGGHGGPHAGAAAGAQAGLDDRGAEEAGEAGTDGVGNQEAVDGSRAEGGAVDGEADKTLQDGERCGRAAGSLVGVLCYMGSYLAKSYVQLTIAGTGSPQAFTSVWMAREHCLDT